MSRLDEALSYAERGWAVLPLHSVNAEGRCSCGGLPGCSPGKHPRIAGGVNAASSDPERVRVWWRQWPEANVGIALGPSGLVSVAPDSPQWAEEFERLGLPPAPRYQSGGGEGHWHALYKRPEGVPPLRRCRSGEYDLLADGYIVAPPSMHASGRPYQWIVTPNGTLPEAPGWVVEMLMESSPTPPTEPIDPDEPPVALDADAMTWWTGERVIHADEGKLDRSGTLLRIAGMLAQAGANRATIIDALRNRDLTLWPEPKYATRNDGGFAGYDEKARKALAGRLFSIEILDERKEDSGDWKLFTAAELRGRPPARWLVQNLLQEATIAVLYAESGAGKSVVALDLMLAVTTGGGWNGLDSQTGTTVYIAAEGDEHLDPRIRAWEIERGRSAPENAYFLPAAVDLRDRGQVTKLITLIDALPEAPVLVIIDPLADSMPGASEISFEDLSTVIQTAKHIQRRYHATVLIVHHTRVAGDRERGHTALRAAASTMLYQRADDRQIKLTIDKQRGGGKRPPMYFEIKEVALTSMQAEFGAEPLVLNSAPVLMPVQGEERLANHQRTLLLALRGEGWVTATTCKEMAEAAGVPKSSYYEARKALKDLGLIESEPVVDGKPKHPRIRLTEQGEIAAQKADPDNPFGQP